MKNNIYQECLDHWGLPLQKLMCIEEMSELTKELVKEFRGFENQEKICEEIADVYLMLQQMICCYDIKLINKYKQQKIRRLKQLLNKGD